MADKALISELTWRSLEMQKEAFPDMRHYILPDDVSFILRKTQRKEKDTFHVMSFAVIADNEKDFRSFVEQVWKLGSSIKSQEGDLLHPDRKIKNAITIWREARTKGSAKIGAKISADRKKARVKEACALIADRWPLPSSEYSTKQLLGEADVSLNSVKSVLGSRPIAQYNYRAKHGKQIKQLEMSRKPLREKVDFCGVYIFQIEEGVYKVGSSNDSGRRFQQVSQHHKKQMRVVETFNMDRDKAYRVEMEAHYLLRKLLHREYRGREIFKASLDTIKKAINKAIKNVTEVPKYE